MSKPMKCFVFVNPINGRVSAMPYPGFTDEQFRGWTVSHPDGTTGIGRKPFETEQEAQAWCDAHPNFPGMNQG